MLAARSGSTADANDISAKPSIRRKPTLAGRGAGTDNDAPGQVSVAVKQYPNPRTRDSASRGIPHALFAVLAARQDVVRSQELAAAVARRCPAAALRRHHRRRWRSWACDPFLSRKPLLPPRCPPAAD